MAFIYTKDLARHKSFGLVGIISELETQGPKFGNPLEESRYRVKFSIPATTRSLTTNVSLISTVENAKDGDFIPTTYQDIKQDFDKANDLTGQYNGLLGRLRELVLRYLF